MPIYVVTYGVSISKRGKFEIEMPDQRSAEIEADRRVENSRRVDLFSEATMVGEHDNGGVVIDVSPKGE